MRKQSYYQRIDMMQQQLSDYLARDDAIDKSDLADAEQLLTRWRQADDRINAYIAVGNYQAATQVALGTGEDDSTPAFDKLDAALGKGIEESRSQCATTSATPAGCCRAHRRPRCSPSALRWRWRWGRGHD